MVVALHRQWIMLDKVVLRSMVQDSAMFVEASKYLCTVYASVLHTTGLL